ncbi:hypothetical protein BB560_000059 [Smittium megazygosporum]|uniref:Tr-type G domain-containing protein n=1 Tax=Smittium megazygosporum TaxID=133381 RepID=A0A2T9ZLF3_9FUNG|nr:hypothetical protein BB560_000059 [Smittium megazygosporum]
MGENSKYQVNFEELGAQISKLQFGANDSDSESFKEDSIMEKLLNPSKTNMDFLVSYYKELFDKKGPQLIYTLDCNDTQINKILDTLLTISNHPEIMCSCKLLYNSTKVVTENEENNQANSSNQTDRALYFLLRKIPQKIENLIEQRISVIGNVDAGKSTTLGVLTKGALDNGRGSARKNIFRHKHEIESGRTSSIGSEMIGFDKDSSDPIYAENVRSLSWNDISSKASKVVIFHDLAGHEKYLKTTVLGLTIGQPETVMLVVGANAGMVGMAKEHLGLTLALQVPVFFVITKVDMCPKNVLDDTLKSLFKLLKSQGIRKVPFQIRSMADVIASVEFSNPLKICPIFLVSNTTGQGLDFLRQYLNILPPSTPHERDTQAFMEIKEIFSVPFVGSVVSGILDKGSIAVGDSFWIGPDQFGRYQTTSIKSIQYNRVNVPISYAGQSVSLCLKKIPRSSLRRGMVLLQKIENFVPKSYSVFEADILILYHTSTISLKYQAVIHCRAIRQTARIIHIYNKENLRSGDKAKVVLKFMSQPEFLTVGSRIIFREGKTKGIGKITKLYEPEQVPRLLEQLKQETPTR